METWEVFIKDHHEGYIGWAEFERNQAVLAANAYGRAGDTKSGRFSPRDPSCTGKWIGDAHRAGAH